MVNIIDLVNTEKGYGAVAVKAVELIKSGVFKNPKYAWDEAACEILNSKSIKYNAFP